jgi:hypothetical protein
MHDFNPFDNYYNPLLPHICILYCEEESLCFSLVKYEDNLKLIYYGSHAPSSSTLPYKSIFVSPKLPTVTLRQDFADGSHQKKQCPVFNGEHGIEAFFYVEEHFRKLAAHNFLWAGDGPGLFMNFKELFVNTTLTNWEDITANIGETGKTADSFDAAIQEMYHKYVGAEARDTQSEYFKTLRKPMKADQLTHSSRMFMLARYGNKLPGTDPVLTEAQIKNVFSIISHRASSNSSSEQASQWQILNPRT